MRNLTKRLMPLADLLVVPFVYPAALLLKAVRRIGVQRLPLSRRALLQVGVFPIRNHYYEPQFDMSQLRRPLADERALPGIDWNIPEQLQLLQELRSSAELTGSATRNPIDFDFNNGSFGTGDAEFLYQIIRLKKPQRIYEIGSGNSTLMAIKAVQANHADDPGYRCRHVCVEPYEMPWLEKTGVTVIRKKVEDVGVTFFEDLAENDILFIDSSHIIRPDGDVLFEYLELLPCLNRGVIVHIHDIFSPRNYLSDWLHSDVRFWNEQYLLEAYLSHNQSWCIIASLNHLHHHHFEKLKSVCPFLAPEREPGSFYIQKCA